MHGFYKISKLQLTSTCPPRSPDLTPYHLFFIGLFKIYSCCVPFALKPFGSETTYYICSSQCRWNHTSKGFVRTWSVEWTKVHMLSTYVVKHSTLSLTINYVIICNNKHNELFTSFINTQYNAFCRLNIFVYIL